MKRNQVVDTTTGRVDLRYNPLSVEEDYFIPVRGSVQGTKIETIAGGKHEAAIEDVKYLRDKLFSALKIPAAYISSDGEKTQEDKTTLAQKDIRFARTVQRLQRSIITELEKIGIVHLYTLGYRDEDLVSFKCSLNNPSKIAEMQQLEHWKAKFDIVGGVAEGFFSKQWLAKNLFGLSDEEFVRNRREMFYDRRFEAALETAGEVEQAEATAGIDAGADDLGGGGGADALDAIDKAEGGTGTVGGEPELGAPDPETPAGDAGGAPPAAPTADAEGEGALLAEPPGKRRDKDPNYVPVKQDKRSTSAPRKKNMFRAASPEFASSRKTLPGMQDLRSLARGTSVYAEQNTNYKVEELKILQSQKELKLLFESLKARDEKDETEA